MVIARSASSDCEAAVEEFVIFLEVLMSVLTGFRCPSSLGVVLPSKEALALENQSSAILSSCRPPRAGEKWVVWAIVSPAEPS